MCDSTYIDQNITEQGTLTLWKQYMCYIIIRNDEAALVQNQVK